jgi:hypothetical protein
MNQSCKFYRLLCYELASKRDIFQKFTKVTFGRKKLHDVDVIQPCKNYLRVNVRRALHTVVEILRDSGISHSSSQYCLICRGPGFLAVI